MNVQELLREGFSFLKNKNIPSYTNDAMLILSNIMQVEKLDLPLIIEKKLSNDIIKKFRNDISLRAKKIPLQHIIGYTYFFGNKIYVNKHVLIPRFETEIMCEYAINLFKNKDDKITALDLCTGSGCIAIALKNNLNSIDIDAIDISNEALNVAKLNSNINNLEINFIQNDLLNNIEKKYDLIISNPPYLTEDEMKNLDEEVKYDPELALYGGSNGLNIIKNIIDTATNNLKKDGFLILEFGYKQANDVINLLFDKYKNVDNFSDYNNINRFICANIK